jgi:diketogulonate reductase-like aldo/keto reductase
LGVFKVPPEETADAVLHALRTGYRAIDTAAATELKADGRARSIGVSNFLVEQLQRTIDATAIVPAVNQIELHPWLQQTELRPFHGKHGILTEAWSPLVRIYGFELDDQQMSAIAQLDRGTRTGPDPATFTGG